jgi:hypothetical protein
MSTSNCVGPSLENLKKAVGKPYYTLNGLLDELDMKDEEEREEFEGLCNSYFSWDDEKITGYKTDEHIAIPDKDFPCYAKRFMDECGIMLPTAGLQDPKVGIYYFPQHDLDTEARCSPHRKKWNYPQHHKGIIEIVAALMITRKTYLAKAARYRLSKKQTSKAGSKRVGSRHSRRAAACRQETPSASLSCVTDDEFGE